MRMIKALAGGLAVGIIVTEALLAAVQVLTDNPTLSEDLAVGQLPPGSQLLAVAIAWLLGSVLAGAMSTAMSQLAFMGWLAGAMLCLPALLLLVLSGLPWGLVSVGFLPLAGAIAGSATARRLLPA